MTDSLSPSPADLRISGIWHFWGPFRAAVLTGDRALKKLPNYRSYLACGTEHCAFDRATFYSTTTGGVRLGNWVAGQASGRNVSCPECKR
jgi:hypothetical protein